jgi:hypothetical protein
MKKRHQLSHTLQLLQPGPDERLEVVESRAQPLGLVSRVVLACLIALWHSAGLGHGDIVGGGSLACALMRTAHPRQGRRSEGAALTSR